MLALLRVGGRRGKENINLPSFLLSIHLQNGKKGKVTTNDLKMKNLPQESNSHKRRLWEHRTISPGDWFLNSVVALPDTLGTAPAPDLGGGGLVPGSWGFLPARRCSKTCDDSPAPRSHRNHRTHNSSPWGTTIPADHRPQEYYNDLPVTKFIPSPCQSKVN